MLAEAFLNNYLRLSATVVQYAVAAVRHDVMTGYKKRKREEVRVTSVGVIHGASLIGASSGELLDAMIIELSVFLVSRVSCLACAASSPRARQISL